MLRITRLDWDVRAALEEHHNPSEVHHAAFDQRGEFASMTASLANICRTCLHKANLVWDPLAS